MSHHEGVSCDSCLKNNFRGKRYKCLICFDYDLCATCHDSGTLNGRHTTDHPMQCILTRSDLDFYFAGELIDQPHSFTCPFCGKLGFTDTTLYDHVSTLHTDITTQVVCPICATLPGGEPNQITDDFLTHLSVEHRNNQPHIVRIRSRHHPRGLNNRSRRSQFLNPGASSSTSSTSAGGSGGVSLRDPIDPITQLLSQLSDVRRVNGSSTGASTASSLTNGMMQLQFERQSTSGSLGGGGVSASNRLPIERIIRRHQASSAALSSSLAAAHSEAAGNASNSSSSTSSHMPYMVLLDPSTSQAVSNVPANSKSAASSSGKRQNTKYLLASSNTSGSTSPTAEMERERANTLRADRSIFVEEMILATLGEPLSIEAIFASSSATADQEMAAKTATSSEPSIPLEQSGSSKSASESETEKAVIVESSPSDVQEVAASSMSVDGEEVEAHSISRPKTPVIEVSGSGSTSPIVTMPHSENEEEDASSFVPRKPSFRSSNIESSNATHDQSVQPQKPLPSFATANTPSPFLSMSSGQGPLSSSSATHRSTRSSSQQKPLRPVPASASSAVGGVPLAIRSSLSTRPGLTSVVSPTGARRSKVVPPQHKHSTEPPPN